MMHQVCFKCPIGEPSRPTSRTAVARGSEGSSDSVAVTGSGRVLLRFSVRWPTRPAFINWRSEPAVLAVSSPENTLPSTVGVAAFGHVR